MGCKIYSNINYHNTIEGATENIGEGLQWKVFITYKFTQLKTSRTLKLDEFKIPDNRNIEKLFLKNEKWNIEKWTAFLWSS